MKILIISAVLTYCLTLAFVPYFLRVAKRRNIMDVPDRDIKKHSKPVPYLGGAAIYCSLVITFLVLSIFFRQLASIKMICFITGITIVCGIGMADDLYNLKPWQKIIVELIASFIFIYGGMCMTITDLPRWFNVFLTCLWFIGIINALNIIDIMDGLAGGVGLIAGVVFLLLALQTNKMEMAVLSTMVIGLTAGFLRYNFFPAGIYLGDAGSLLLGAFLGVLAVMGSYTSLNEIGLFTPVLILGIPVYDTFFVMGVRWLTGKPVLKGSNDHIALRISATGLGKKNTVIFLYLVSMLLGMSALTIVSVKLEIALIIYVLVIITALLAAWKLGEIEMK